MTSASPRGITTSRLCSHEREKLATTVLTCISVQRGLKIFSHVVGTCDKLLLPVFSVDFKSSLHIKEIGSSSSITEEAVVYTKIARMF